MTKLQQAIRKAHRRTLANGIIRHAGQGALLAAAASVVVLAVDRGADLGWSWIVYACLAAAGLLAGAIVAIARQRDSLAAAVHLDRSLHLKDRIGSAALLKVTPGCDEGFARLVERDAERFAGRIDVRQAVPIRIPRLWAGALGAFALVALGFAFIPPAKRTPPGPDPAVVAAQQQALEQQRELIVDEIAQAVEQVREQEDTLPTEAREELAALDRLAEQLAGRPPSEKELKDARDESAARLNQLAERLAERSQREQAAAQEVAERFRQLETPDAPMSAKEFTKALQRGEFDDAAAALEKLLDERGALSEAERRALGEHLKKLSESARRGDAPQQQQQQQLDERREQIAQALRDQGFDEQQIEEILEPQTTEQREQKLREQPLDQEIAEDLARDLRALNERQETAEQAEQQSQELADALDEAQRQFAPPEVSPDTPPAPETPQPTPPDSQQPQPPQQKPPPGDTTEEQQQQQPGAESQQTQQEQQPQSQPRDGAQPQPQPQPAPSGQEQPQPGGEQPDPQQQEQPQPQTGEATEPRETPQPGEQIAPEPQPGAQPQPQPQESPDQSQQDQQQQQTAPDQQLPQSPEQQPIVKPGETPSEQPQPGGALKQPDPQQPQQQQQAPPESPELPKLPENPPPADMLRRLAERMREADKRQQTSERLREMAKRLAESMSDEQKQRWAEQWRKAMEDQPPPSPDEEQQQRNLEQQMQEQLADRDREQMPGGPGAGEQKPGEREPGEAPLPSNYSAENLEEVDARGDEVGDRVLAEWLSDESSEGDPQRTTVAGGGAARVRRAKEVAERAVDDSTVPARYHELIRRYFGRLDETARKARSASGAPGTRPPATKDDGGS